MWTIYVDPEDPCNVALMTYPGTSFDQSDLEYDAAGCVDLKASFPRIYANLESDFENGKSIVKEFYLNAFGLRAKLDLNQQNNQS